jgi:two-component system phosphate regulon sensor histidine kinase PhoR
MREQLVLIGADDSIYLANDAFCRLFGLRKDSIVGKRYEKIIMAQEVSGFIRVALKSQKPEYSKCAMRGECKKPEYYQMCSSPIISEKGWFRGIVLMFHNVTPMKTIEKMRRKFLDNAAHELKTPLSTVLRIAETLIEREPTDGETRRKFYRAIFKSTDRLCTLANDLLDLSEIEQKSTSLKFAPNNIGKIIKDIVEEFSEAVASRNHHVELQLPDTLADISADRKTLSKALGNVLDNAIKYTKDSGVVSIGVEKEEDSIRIDIKDSGIGICPEDVERIFERFYRADRTRSIESGGTGLGLAVAMDIVKAHGGKIKVSSPLGKGSKFSIYLPL